MIIFFDPEVTRGLVIRSTTKGGQVLELEIKHKHGGFNVNYEKATVVWQQFGSGS
jgi:hypothetical protein